ncbi:MBL fold metallo-hydrolase [Streptomyces sp. SDT5-1]|uniref:MBL fold metallo-hydrolase n=1 Tax=Streptomyces sp. SDT5-1 TaxID=3406418 RepID=UPI003FD05C3C
MCDLPATASCADPGEATVAKRRGPSRRGVVGALAAAVTAGGLPGLTATATASTAASRTSTPSGSEPLSLTLLGTLGGSPPLAARFGISSALVVNGRTYVVDCGRGAVSQYMRAGLSMPSLAGIFLTHLHADHTADYFNFPLLSAGVEGKQGFQSTVDVYGPGPSGLASRVADAAGATPGIAELTRLASRASAASTTFFLAEHLGIDPVTLLDVHEVMPPDSAGASSAHTAPTGMAPFTVMENDDVKVSAILVPHGAVYPAYAYRFDTEYGSVVFSGDTGPTPNIPRLAKDADILVHETADMAVLPELGYPTAAIDHIRAVHTDVTLLGGIAAEAGVRTLVASHLTPGDPTVLSDAQWRKSLRASAREADFRGAMILGEDLMRVPIPSARRS